MSETTYHLYALCQGSRACDASWLLYLSESGRTRTLPYFFWILTPEDGGAPIVIDTGFSEESQKARNPDYADYRQQRELLGHFGIKPSDVETLIVSHLHWDHFMSPRLFTGPRAFISKGASSISGGATRRNTTSSTIFWETWDEAETPP